jgi:hypothetical protein
MNPEIPSSSTPKNSENVFPPVNANQSFYGGFKCGSYNCSHLQGIIGDIYLPFCLEKCAKRNVEYLLMENKKKDGEILSLQSVLNNTVIKSFEDRGFEESMKEDDNL